MKKSPKYYRAFLVLALLLVGQSVTTGVFWHFFQTDRHQSPAVFQLDAPTSPAVPTAPVTNLSFINQELIWTVASHQDILGFHLFHTEPGSSVPKRLTDELIHFSSENDYAFLLPDSELPLPPDRSYFLQVVLTTGRTENYPFP